MSQHRSTIRYTDGAQQCNTQPSAKSTETWKTVSENNSEASSGDLCTIYKAKMTQETFLNYTLTDMDYTLALLFSLLQVLSGAMAVPVPDILKMKSKVKLMAQQLAVRVDKDFQIPAGLTLNPPSDDLDGSSSVVTVLEGYNSLISDTLNGVSQVKFEISSLTGYLDQWRQGHNCTEQQPKSSVSGPLQELQSQKQFIHTVSIEALMRVKEFLNLLLKNLDHLETC